MKQTHRRACTPVCLILCLLLALSLIPSAALGARGDVVRVGFFAFEGYHNIDENGGRSGYGYEYLQHMARYTGWTYDYVGYDKSWSEMQQMLADGEIDLLTSAQKTPEREALFDFSDEPIGYSSTIFTIKAGNTRFTIDDYNDFDSIRVGMLAGNSRNADFAAFAQEKGFTYIPVVFQSTGELVAALQSEDVDAAVTSSLRATTGEWIVSEFSFSPYYVCVRKGDSERLQEVNDAIGRLNQNNPSLQNELEDKYYGGSAGGAVPFTELERSYIAGLKATGRRLRVLVNPDRAPLSYYENGAMAGIYG